MKVLIRLCLLLAVVFGQTLYAAVPQTINYQGHLADSGGAPVNGAVNMTFTIYDAATNGANLWTEDQVIQVNNGLYSVVLGAVNSIDSAIIDGDLWLGVRVENDIEMTPRQKLHSVPFALRAQTIESNYEEAICAIYDWHKKTRPEFCEGRHYKIVFITNTTYTGDLGGVEGADQKCRDAATSASLPGEFKAWLSDANSQPKDTFTRSSVPYVLLDGNYFIDNWTDLASGVAPYTSISIDEYGNPITSSYNAWTATSYDGSRAVTDNCFNWTMSSNNSGWVGTGSAAGSWTISSRYTCNSKFRLYCFEQ